jgi:hypothetical protein
VERDSFEVDPEPDEASPPAPSHRPSEQAMPGKRMLLCPTGWSLGRIYTRPPGNVWTGSCSYWANAVGDARGRIQVPKDQQVRLWASQRHADDTPRSPTDLTPLREFEPDALDSLFVRYPSSDQLHNIEHLNGLSELILDRPFSDDALAATNLGALTQLRGLQIFYADVTDRAVQPLLQSLPRVAYRSLSGTGVGDDTLRTAAELENLTALNLTRTDITDEGVRTLAQANRLLSVDLSETKVTDAGIRELASCGLLQRLSLADTRVTDEGLAFLSQAQDLRYLDLADTDITGSIFATIRRLPQLQLLVLPGGSLGDEALHDLHGMPQLRYLSLTERSVTPAGLLALVDSLPNLNHLWVGGTPFRSMEGIEQLKERLRQAPAGTRSLHRKKRAPTGTQDQPWPGAWQEIQIPASAGRGDIRSIARASSGLTWVASFGQNPDDSASAPSWRQPEWSPPDEGPCVLERTTGLAIGPDDTVWAIHDQELWEYNSGCWRRVIQSTPGRIGGVTASPDRTAHAYRMTGTLYSIRDSVTTTKEAEFLSSIANCIAADATGTIWIGTSAGISRLKDGTWRSWKGSADGLPVVRDPGMDQFGWETRDWTPVTSIAIDPTGVTWIAGNGGIARFTEDGWELHASRNELPYFFHSITTDDDGRVYATGGRNVATYLEGSWRVAEAPDHLLPEQRPLRAIDVRPDGIWVGAEGALLQFQPTSWD